MTNLYPIMGVLTKSWLTKPRFVIIYPLNSRTSQQNCLYCLRPSLNASPWQLYVPLLAPILAPTPIMTISEIHLLHRYYTYQRRNSPNKIDAADRLCVWVLAREICECGSREENGVKDLGAQVRCRSVWVVSEVAGDETWGKHAKPVDTDLLIGKLGQGIDRLKA